MTRRLKAAYLWQNRYFFFRPPFLRGTFFPLLRASESPIAIACLRLLTFLPLLPLLSVPRLRLRIARSTSLDALREYRRAIFNFLLYQNKLSAPAFNPLDLTSATLTCSGHNDHPRRAPSAPLPKFVIHCGTL
jgi:hypothetical protein